MLEIEQNISASQMETVMKQAEEAKRAAVESARRAFEDYQVSILCISISAEIYGFKLQWSNVS
jgi:hypothetical protein